MRLSTWLCTLAACSGKTGVISVSLATAPGSSVLDAVQTLRMTITEPPQVLTAERSNGGFDIGLDLPATGDPTRLLVDGLDASGTVIASGASPPFPIGAIDATLVIYMAAPNSVAMAPAALPHPRSELAAGALPYGVILAGGRDVDGSAGDEVLIYNAFTHAFTSGLSLPAPRSGMSLATGTVGLVYLFGGRDAAGVETATEWRFDTTVAPSGIYVDYGDKAGFARADQLLLPLGNEHFLLTGTPAAELSGLDGSLVAHDETMLPAAGATVMANDGVVTSIFAGVDAVTKFRNGTFTPLPITQAARDGARVVAIPGGKVAVLCGTTDAVRIDAASGMADVFANTPAEAKTGCAVAATSRYLVIAGGTTASGVDGSVAIYDATTLELVGTTQLAVPRTNAFALALPDDQILIASGSDALGNPTDAIELFTPAN